MTTSACDILTRRARTTSDKLGRDDSALEDWGRVLDIDYANLAALRAIADIRRRQGEPNELVHALHQLVDRAAALLDAEELKEIFRELGKTYGEQLAAAVRCGRRVAEAARRGARLRGDGRPRGDLPQPKSDGPTSSTSRCAAPTRSTGAVRAQSKSCVASRRSGATRPRSPTGPAPRTRRSSRSTRPTTRRSWSSRSCTQRPAGGSRLSSCISGASRRARRSPTRRSFSERSPRVFEEKLDDKNQALDALVNALSLDFHDRETARYLERMAQATGRWGEVIQQVNGWLKQQTEPHEKIRLCLHLAKWYGDDLGHPEYAQPYYAQIIQLDPHNVGAHAPAREPLQEGRQLAADGRDAHPRARRRDERPRSQGGSERSRRAARRAHAADRAGHHVLPAGARGRSPVPARAREPGAHLRRRADRTASWPTSLQRKVAALKDAGGDRGDEAPHRAALRDEPRRRSRAAQVYREVVEVEPGEHPRPARTGARLPRSSSSGPSWSACSSGSSRS